MIPEEAGQRRKMDEASTLILDTFPRFWWKMFENLKNEGFSELQALDLLKTYIQASLGK